MLWSLLRLTALKSGSGFIKPCWVNHLSFSSDEHEISPYIITNLIKHTLQMKVWM